jgi:hypothetical protein
MDQVRKLPELLSTDSVFACVDAARRTVGHRLSYEYESASDRCSRPAFDNYTPKSLLRWYGTEPDTDHEAGKAMFPAPGSVTAARPARNPASLLLGVLGNMVS